MVRETRHLGVRIQRDAADVYAFCAEPANLPRWAAGLSGSIAQVDGRWLADSPMGRVEVEFAPRNPFGVLDHLVRLPGGDTVENPMRVLRDGEGAEVVFTLRRRDGVTEEEFEADADAVLADLEALKRLLESHEDARRG
ncbi:SRPBCC family protein [Naasia sp. SYSU D00948]|uniref:SRPBCC family protein n=1 Tax=Naasia sp. SYSU D00948 TaxID=2817379 RepID=UPI001B3031DC|nr:SRPBCC family protein [Naasia sp. SYSU D00948]